MKLRIYCGSQSRSYFRTSFNNFTNFLDSGSADMQTFSFTHGMGFWLGCLPFIVTAHSIFFLDILGWPVSGMTGEVSTAEVSGKKETFPVAQKEKPLSGIIQIRM